MFEELKELELLEIDGGGPLGFCQISWEEIDYALRSENRNRP